MRGLWVKRFRGGRRHPQRSQTSRTSEAAAGRVPTISLATLSSLMPESASRAV